MRSSVQKCSQLLNQTESKGSSEGTDLNANERGGSCTLSESDCAEQSVPGAVHHPH